MSDVEITIKLPAELVQDAENFASLLREETDRRIMDFVNSEIKAYRAEKSVGRSSSTDRNS